MGVPPIIGNAVHEKMMHYELCNNVYQLEGVVLQYLWITSEGQVTTLQIEVE